MNEELARDNLKGGAWLLADMSLTVWALSIVKWLGDDIPATQMVFVRALTGFVLILPFVWRNREKFIHIKHLRLHLFRILLSVVTLTASFFAISRVPLAVFTAIGFTRPIVVMLMSVVFLRELVGPRRWFAAGVSLVGIVVAVDPGALPTLSGLAALAIVVVSGSAAIVVTRRLRSAPHVVMMSFYTAGLALCTAPFALSSWVGIDSSRLMPLLLVGAFSQLAQLCFLRAHHYGEAGFLSVLSYCSLIISVSVGFFVFAERPGPQFAIGAALVISASFWVSLRARVAGTIPNRN